MRINLADKVVNCRLNSSAIGRPLPICIFSQTEHKPSFLARRHRIRWGAFHIALGGIYVGFGFVPSPEVSDKNHPPALKYENRQLLLKGIRVDKPSAHDIPSSNWFAVETEAI